MRDGERNSMLPNMAAGMTEMIELFSCKNHSSSSLAHPLPGHHFSNLHTTYHTIFYHSSSLLVVFFSRQFSVSYSYLLFGSSPSSLAFYFCFQNMLLK